MQDKLATHFAIDTLHTFKTPITILVVRNLLITRLQTETEEAKSMLSMSKVDVKIWLRNFIYTA